jgi:hypothetical protein
MTSMSATVNDGKFLGDDESRRWWVIPILAVNLNHGIDIEQLWAEIKMWYDEGYPYWLDGNELKTLNSNNRKFDRDTNISQFLENSLIKNPKEYGWTELNKQTEIMVDGIPHKVLRKNSLGILTLLNYGGAGSKISTTELNDCSKWLKKQDYKKYTTTNEFIFMRPVYKTEQE